MKKTFLTGIFLGCLLLLPRAAMAQDPDPALVTKAEAGDAEAQYKLGDHYFNKRDGVNGMKWTRKAAEQGHAAAQNSLGIRYFIGGSVTRDIDEAEKWFRKSAAQEGKDFSAKITFDAAEDNLCKLFAQKVGGMKGTSPPFPANIQPLKGTAADVKEAFDWCGKVAGRGYPSSQFRLGALYAKGGGGVTADYQQAYFWLSVSKRPDVFRDKVSPHLTQEKRDEIEKLARAWKEGTPPPFPAAKTRPPPG